MSIDVDSFLKSYFEERYNFKEKEELAPQWRDWHEYIKFLLWAATDTLLTHDKIFHESGYQRLNFRSVTYLEQICHFLTESKIDEEQAINFMGEWIGILLAREPGYVLTFRKVIFKTYRKESVGRTKNIFINIFSDGYFFEVAEKLLKQKQSERQVTKNTINDYLNIRQKSSKDVSSTGNASKCIKCLLSSKQIMSLHEQLLQAGFIAPNVPFDLFNKLFNVSLTEFHEPIKWLKKTSSLGYLFYELDNNRQVIIGKWQNLLGDANKVFSTKNKVISTSNYSSIVNNLRASNGKGKISSEQLIIKGIIDNVLTIGD